MVNRTQTGEKIKQLLAKANQIDDVIASLSYKPNISAFEMKAVQMTLNDERNKLLSEATALKPFARLEDTSVFKVEKPVRKKMVQSYWFSSWAVNGKRRNVYLGSCASMDADTALQKARKLKAEMLGLTLVDYSVAPKDSY